MSAATQRSAWLLAGGALAGLALAASQLFAARGAVQLGLPDDAVALVNGRPVLWRDYENQTQALTGKPFKQATAGEREGVLQDMLREELFVQRGTEMDFAASDTEVRAALVRAVEQQVTASVQVAVPEEAVLRRFHSEHAAEFQTPGTMALQGWALRLPADDAGSAEARRRVFATLAAVKQGADPARAWAAAGLQPMADLPGEPDLYVALQRRLGDAPWQEVRLLPAGTWTQPLVLGDRLAVLKVVQHTPPRPRSFEEARQDVQRAWQKDAGEQRLRATYELLRAKAEIRLAPGLDARGQP